MIILYLALSLLVGFGVGIFTARRQASMYRQRWIEAKKLWEDERTSPLPEGPKKKLIKKAADHGSTVDYHTLSSKARWKIAKERFDQNLPIEDDLEYMPHEYDYARGEYLDYKTTTAELRLKQERENEKAMA